MPLEIDVTAVKAKLDEGEAFLLLDCREQHEYEIVRIESAQLLPMSEIADRVEELRPHQESEIVIHCHRGMRSLQVAQWLAGQGFANVKSMAGGIDRWAVEIDPDLPRY